MGSSHSLAHRGAILPFCWFFFLRGWITFFKFNIALATLDVRGWNCVSRIGSSFLDRCSALRTLNFSGWSNVTRIGLWFLSNCSELKTLNLSGWTSVTQIGNYFMHACTIPTSSINITGSRSVVSEHVKNRIIMEEDGCFYIESENKSKNKSKCKCVCM